MTSGAGDVLAERERESGLCDFNTISHLGPTVENKQELISGTEVRLSCSYNSSLQGGRSRRRSLVCVRAAPVLLVLLLPLIILGFSF